MRRARYFFVVLGIVFIVVAALGFGPHLLAFAAGKFPISPIAHIHGALMTAWLLTFVAQSVLAAKGRIDLHRKLGACAVWLGAVIWISIVSLTVRDYMNHKYPLNENIFYSLPQLYVIAVFGTLFTAAIVMRRNSPWHKRFMVIATISLLQAGVDRYSWLPEQGPGYWPQVACLDVLLVLLVAFDFISFKRIHRATLVGGGFLIACQSAVAFLWPTAWWHQSSVRIAHELVRMF
jgi:hypothetical protein